MLRMAFILLAVLLSGCSRPASDYHQQIYVFGTMVDVTIWGERQERAQEVIALIDADFQRMHHEWTVWEPSPLTAINDAIAAGQTVDVLPSIQPLISQSQMLYRQSDGLFNPAIGRLLNLWGFQSNSKQNRPPPPREAIEEWVKAQPGMDDVVLSDGVLTSSNRFVSFDFGAFAKGYAVDLAIERLKSMGIANAIVNGGGDLRAIGKHGDRPWRIGIRHPQGGGVLAALEVGGDESVFTSGNYERFDEYEGVRYTHILDPRTGWPVQGITSVTVIHDNGAVADAAATALVVAGVKDWHHIAKAMGIRYVMLVDEAGTIYMNPAMAGRVQFQESKPNIVLGEPL